MAGMLEHNITLITGGSTGIGASICRHFLDAPRVRAYLAEIR